MKECPTCRSCFPDDILHCPDDGAATTSSISGEPILDGRYQLEKRLGQGGMGVVYKARHIFLKTAHAIKIILPDLVGNDPNLVTRFRQDALAAAASRDQNIIAVTDFGVVRGTMPFLVMEFVQGKSLQEIMGEEGAMPAARAFELMQPICGGIAAAHRQKIVHRDLKPLNVMVQDGIPINEGTKILDFGLAKIKSGELLGSFIAAQTTGLMGSPFYMAPEQWSAEEFMKELREAMAAASAVLRTTGDKKIDPFKTVTMPRAPAQPTISPSVAQTAYDPLAGTISGTSLVDEEEKLRIAREELAREEDAKRRLAAAEAERKRTEEAERRAQEERVRAAEQKRAEEQAREELRKREEERQRVEELVAKQTKAIE